MKILVVGFEKYATHKTNPSKEVLPLIKEEVTKLVLPSSFERSKKLFLETLDKEKPDAVMILNLSPFHKEPTLEHYAYNEMDSVQPDEDKVLKTHEPIIEGGAKSYAASFDLPRMQQVLVSEGTNVSLAVDGGRFFDNEAYYLALSKGIPSIMIHLPEEKNFPLEEDAELIDILVRFIDNR